jgi:hypothetical protein
MIAMAGIMFFLFVGFNYAIHSEGGLKEHIWASANNTMSGEQLTKFNNLMPQLSQGFGIGCILCIALAVVFFIVDAFRNPPGEMRY